MAARRLIDRRAQAVEASKARPAKRRSARIARFELKFRDLKCLESGDGFPLPFPRGLPRQSLPLAKAGSGIHFGQRIPKLELEDAVRHLDEAIPVQEGAHDASRLAGIAGPPIGRL